LRFSSKWVDSPTALLQVQVPGTSSKIANILVSDIYLLFIYFRIFQDIWRIFGAKTRIFSAMTNP
jgi:hypothetical protein